MSKERKLWLWRLLLIALVFCGAAPLFAEGGDPSARVARLGYIQGSVSVQPAGVDQWSQAEINYPVSTGDRLYSDQNGRDELNIGGVVVRMWHTTDLTMTNLSDQLTQLGLAQGTIRVRTFGLDPNQQVEIDTPNGAVVVTQPGDIRVDSYEGDGGTQVTVNSGAVQVSGPNLLQNIGQGASVRLMGSNPIEMEQVAMPGLDEFDQWSIQRDRHMEDARSAQYVSRYTPGYDDLDDYGSWDPGTEYGPVWYPSQVPVDWAPYRYGHWVWTGPWGWTWVEDEPWGYAPFHYGRWAFIGARWGWVPGPVIVRPVWAPALVAFVGGGGFSIGIGLGGVSAWFPLGVGEPYIPWYHCSPAYIRQVNVTNIDITRIRNVTIVNNYNNFVRNSNNFENIREVNYNYANRDRGFTATPGRAFASGQPVYRNLARISPDQIRSAHVIAHPSIQPTRSSIVPRPVSRPLPVPSQRPTLLTRGGREAQAVPGARPQSVPYRPLSANAGRPATAPNGPTPGNRPGAPVQPGNRALNEPAPQRPNFPAVRPNAPGEGNVSARPLITRNGETTMPGRPAPGNGSRANPPANYSQPYGGTSGNRGYPTQGSPVRPGGNSGYVRPGAPNAPAWSGRSVSQPRPLIMRNEPPAPQPTFQQQQRGFPRDPGRPLDPQQKENLSLGRSPGPSQDREYLPHAQQVQRQQPNFGAQARPNYAPRQEQRSSPPRESGGSERHGH